MCLHVWLARFCTFSAFLSIADCFSFSSCGGNLMSSSEPDESLITTGVVFECLHFSDGTLSSGMIPLVLTCNRCQSSSFPEAFKCSDCLWVYIFENISFIIHFLCWVDCQDRNICHSVTWISTALLPPSHVASRASWVGSAKGIPDWFE